MCCYLLRQGFRLGQGICTKTISRRAILNNLFSTILLYFSFEEYFFGDEKLDWRLGNFFILCPTFTLKFIYFPLKIIYFPQFSEKKHKNCFVTKRQTI